MKIKAKTVFYWLSVVRPVVDVLIGTWKGIENYVKEVKKAEKLASEQERFEALDELPAFVIQEVKGKNNGKNSD